jgi:AcrR family transcriptional regulator
LISTLPAEIRDSPEAAQAAGRGLEAGEKPRLPEEPSGESVVRVSPIIQRGRGRPRDEEARTRILESALNVLEEFGFANTTADAIAERAGASKATIYRWWQNKAAVLIDALRERVAKESPFPQSGDVKQDIHRQLQNFIALLTGRHGRIFKAFIAAAQSDEEFAEAFRKFWIQPRRAEAKSVLERHQRAGSLAKDLELEIVLDLIYGPIYFRLLAGHAPLTPDFARTVADIALEGIVRS